MTHQTEEESRDEDSFSLVSAPTIPGDTDVLTNYNLSQVANHGASSTVAGGMEQLEMEQAYQKAPTGPSLPILLSVEGTCANPQGEFSSVQHHAVMGSRQEDGEWYHYPSALDCEEDFTAAEKVLSTVEDDTQVLAVNMAHSIDCAIDHCHRTCLPWKRGGKQWTLTWGGNTEPEKTRMPDWFSHLTPEHVEQMKYPIEDELFTEVGVGDKLVAALTSSETRKSRATIRSGGVSLDIHLRPLTRELLAETKTMRPSMKNFVHVRDPTDRSSDVLMPKRATRTAVTVESADNKTGSFLQPVT